MRRKEEVKMTNGVVCRVRCCYYSDCCLVYMKNELLEPLDMAG